MPHVERCHTPPVLIAHDRPDDFRDLLTARFPAEAFVYATTAPGILGALARHDPEAVFSIKHPGFPDAAHAPIPAHPSVRWIQIGGSGLEHLAPWDAGRITVTNGAGVLAPYLAETVTGAMLALGGGLLNYATQQRARRWKPAPFTPLRGRTLLVAGFGRIGECVARNAKALGMRVLAIRGTPAPQPRSRASSPRHHVLRTCRSRGPWPRATGRTAYPHGACRDAAPCQACSLPGGYARFGCRRGPALLRFQVRDTFRRRRTFRIRAVVSRSRSETQRRGAHVRAVFRGLRGRQDLPPPVRGTVAEMGNVLFTCLTMNLRTLRLTRWADEPTSRMVWW